MDLDGSVHGDGVLAKLRALAAKGARLRRGPDGCGLVIDRKAAVRASLDAREMEQARGAGWLTGTDLDEFSLSRKGAVLVRRQLNLRAGEAAAAPRPAVQDQGSSPPQPAASSRPAINPAESPLAWLRQRRDPVTGQPMISATQFEAGERLRADFELARLQPRVTASWDETAAGHRPVRGVPGAGLEIPELAAAARQRVNAAMFAVGPEHSGLLVDVCCFLTGLEVIERRKRWPRRSAKLMLQTGLSILARHYGLEPPAMASAPAAIRLWAAPDYRPPINKPGKSKP